MGQVVADNKFRSFGFAYDANGRQVKATKTGVPDAWTVYDALGNRVATKINDVWQYMIYDAFGKLIAEYGLLSEPPASAGGFPSGVKYIQQDWQGSVRAVTNSDGFIVARTDHQAFGEDIGIGTGLRSVEQGYSADKATRQGYGLTENDQSTGQQHTWWRKLETQAGRWTRPDPYKGSMSLGNPQSFNRYAYVSGDPTNFVDPSGLFGQPPCSGGTPVYNTNGIAIGWRCPVARSDGSGGGGHVRGVDTSSSGRGGGSAPRLTPDKPEKEDDCAYSSYKACERAQKQICHAEGEERFYQTLGSGGVTGTVCGGGLGLGAGLAYGAATGSSLGGPIGLGIGVVVGGSLALYLAGKAGKAAEKSCNLKIPEKCSPCKGK